jgi:hypothetical protein
LLTDAAAGKLAERKMFLKSITNLILCNLAEDEENKNNNNNNQKNQSHLFRMDLAAEGNGNKYQSEN